MAPVMALLPLLLVRLAARKPIEWKKAYLISLIGVASHLALDLTNVYGVRLLLPFSARWLRLDITSVIDPWIWAVFLLAVIGPALSKLIGSEIGERSRPSRTPAIVALSFLALYNCARAVIHERAIATVDSRIYNGAPPRRVAAFPRAYNPFVWRGLVEGDSFYSLVDVNVLDIFDPTDRSVFYFPDERDAIRVARQTEVFRDFLAFSQFPVWTVTPISEPANGFRIEVSDLRFGTSPGQGFTATAILNSQLQVVHTSFQFL
jgi:inner membrane protein